MKKIILFTVLGLSLHGGYAQEKKIIKAGNHYNGLAYVDAIDTYLKVAQKGYKSKELFQRLGDSYYYNAKLVDAHKWYAELFALGETVEPEYYYRYAQTLKSVEDYKKADEYMSKFYELTSKDTRANIYNNQKDYKNIIAKNSGRFEIKPVSINGSSSDYGTAFYGDKVLFASTRDTIGVFKAKAKWTGKSFTNLYAADKNETGDDLLNTTRFAKEINSKYHEDSPVFTKDLKTVYFTRNNFNEGKVGRDDKKIINLKIYRANLNAKGEWINIVELPFNSDQYSVAHPALSPDEKTLYFASNMPGTYGESDLFKVAILGENSYGTPINLGNTINTEARETFPFITDKGVLYYATDGQQGLGGLDIYAAQLDEKGMVSNLVNVGSPVNGPMDDFAFIIDEKGKGFFSSNRSGGKGLDDIYSFIEKSPLNLEIQHELAGVVTNSETREVIPGATVTLYDETFNEIGKVLADEKGFYDFKKVPAGKKYYVRAEKEDYETKEKPVDIPNKTGKTNLPIDTAKKVRVIQEGSDLAKIFEIKIIYFDLDKSFIRADAAVELAKILEVMKQYPTMKVDVRSHTDCRQTVAYNAKLSDRRAKETVAWLVKNGIAKDRLTGRGYGESQLVNDCGCEPTNQSSCTEEQHQANRRSEFIIVKM
ncbi:OmpA family protein [Flavobacterium columnare]|uniref:OmpA family outer membrane protein n=4 Tax=Flavobacterium columnare TaxID=996 RepID=G8X7P2_FLACA|nr:OmpA family protein [Flavobacterium columnare]AEW85755.1 OmpA family outer membrane protein [Flavobacterium columnare ATCC 49512]AEW86878.1 OmpA family outer membrane protein [Flavobacterium columnare ATCC 49512]AMO21344.1 OmpA family protein [Flavobacterium columnare]ANO47305.1 OmpA family outer membrane protein [Flavobacterium columnare]ANO47814.1 OmpA family outer membrane protein [Flavobacterium columnare]